MLEEDGFGARAARRALPRPLPVTSAYFCSTVPLTGCTIVQVHAISSSYSIDTLILPLSSSRSVDAHTRLRSPMGDGRASFRAYVEPWAQLSRLQPLPVEYIRAAWPTPRRPAVRADLPQSSKKRGKPAVCVGRGSSRHAVSFDLLSMITLSKLFVDTYRIQLRTEMERSELRGSEELSCESVNLNLLVTTSEFV